MRSLPLLSSIPLVFLTQTHTPKMKTKIRATTQNKTSTMVHFATLTAVLLTIIVLYNNFNDQPLDSSRNLSITSSKSSLKRDSRGSKPRPECDIFKGVWVPNPEAPYYTNETCWAIHNHQNCMKHGRADTEYLRWRWKPHGCKLPIFDPAQFLELMRGKSMAFVGDSMARNQVQSLICLLSRVEYPEDVSPTKHLEFKRWRYTTYNFTLAIFWSPYLVKAREVDNIDPPQTGQFNLYLDEFDEEWTGKIAEFGHVIVSAGHWFTRPVVFHEGRHIVGCNFKKMGNVTNLSMSYGYRKAFRAAFQALNTIRDYKGITYLRTFSPSHFEGGPWNEGGHCHRTRPYKRNETTLEGTEFEFYMIQVEEFRKAKEEGRKRGLMYRLLDTTKPMLLRPDGHPSTFGHWPNEKLTLYNDCVHWCLPGPIDTWNDFLLEILKMDSQSLR